MHKGFFFCLGVENFCANCLLTREAGCAIMVGALAIAMPQNCPYPKHMRLFRLQKWSFRHTPIFPKLRTGLGPLARNNPLAATSQYMPYFLTQK